MRAYLSTQPLYILRSPPINSRFAVHPTAISESAGTSSGEGHHNPALPFIRPHAATSSAAAKPTRHLPNKDELLPKQLRCEPPKLHGSSVTRETAA